MTWTSGDTLTQVRLVDKNDRGTASGHIGLDGNSNMQSPHRIGCFIGGFGNNYTMYSGNWTTYSNASQTDYDDTLINYPGYIKNDSELIDEIQWSQVTLKGGTYNISLAAIKANDGGIFELLHSTASIGLYSTYLDGPLVFNSVGQFSYNPTTIVTAPFRLRCLSGGALRFSRLEIFKTA